MTSSNQHAPNRLSEEKSPYLLQHAYNPVAWFPWGDEAFRHAIQQNKPIFLSVGYSTCHWCHVMERESFEDQEIADLLNQYFICIKVDREERPDIDHLYMEFCQILTGSGGWPLTVIMTPEKEPFYLGTYFPKYTKYGKPGLANVAAQLGTLWREDEARLRNTAREITAAIQNQHTTATLVTSDLPHIDTENDSSEFQDWCSRIAESAYETLTRRFDPKWGGFGRAPKFPSPHTLGFLLRYAHEHPDSQAPHMVRLTLDSMGNGGIYDHIGLGFARYSTDEKWLVPHFEKMLYDNALLAYTYLEAYQELREQAYARKAKEIFTYVLRDMTAAEGGFYSAEDADSEGQEGRFYVWSLAEIQSILGDSAAAIVSEAYDISPTGNFEGMNIPNLLRNNLSVVAERHNMGLPVLLQNLAVAKERLFEAREQRVHPHKDDKILTSWNALMIAALAKGYQVLGESLYLEAAVKAHHFITTKLMSPDFRLQARYREGEVAFLGYLDDYAFLIWSCLELYTACGRPDYLDLALTLQTKQDELFSDPEGGGYFLTGHDAEELLFRPKESYDGALPAGNSVSVLNLLRLGRLTGNLQLENQARKHIQAFAPQLIEYPAGYSAYLQALLLATHPSEELVLSGPLNSPYLPPMQKAFFHDFRPFSSILYQEGSIGTLIPWVKGYPVEQDQVSAFLCRDFTCQQPVTDALSLANLLS